MLKLPSLDLVFSSNRRELETPTGTNPTDGPHAPSSTPPGQHGPKLPPSRGMGAVLLGPAGFSTTIGTTGKAKANFSLGVFDNFENVLCF